MRGRVLEGKYIPSRWMQQGLQTRMTSIKNYKTHSQQGRQDNGGCPSEPYKLIAQGE